MAIQQTFSFDDPAEPAALAPSHPLPQHSPGSTAEETLRRLRTQVGCITTAPTETTKKELFSTGSTTIDRLLPRGGLQADAITEWIADGDGAASLAMIAARSRLQQSAGPLVVVGGPGTFYPPAAAALKIPTDRILWVRPIRHADVVWAIDQSLRCEMTAAVWAYVGPNLDDRDARRFQLAAETGNTPGLFIRPPAVRGRPSFTDVRFHVAWSPANKNQSAIVTLDRCRGGPIGKSVLVSIDHQARIQTPSRTHHETADVRLASELAHPTLAKKLVRRRA